MKFSFVIICHNQKEIVCEAIDSVLNQTYNNIEAIFVDDASTDDTLEYVTSNYSDDRLKIISLEENQGPLLARLAGIEQTSGDWILFLDSDDSYCSNAAEVLERTIKSLTYPVDMIGYGVFPIYTEQITENAKKELEQHISTPHLGYISNQKIMEELYLKRSKTYTLWSKCYSKKLCNDILSNIERDKLFFSEDFYFNFLACDLSRGYFGISDKIYNYLFGAGISGKTTLSLQSFYRYLSGAKSHKNAIDYAKRRGIYTKYKPAFEFIESNVICSAYDRLTRIKNDEKLKASKMYIEAFGIDNILETFERTEWILPEKVSEEINIKELFSYQNKKVKKIGVFYYRLYNGGVERVIHLLNYILRDIGYEIVLITDEPENEKDYPIPTDIQRIVLNCHDSEKISRYSRIINCVKENCIDLIIYHAWNSPRVLWDLIAFKSAGAAVIIHTHTVFSGSLSCGLDLRLKLSSIFSHADGLIVLTEADQIYWSNTNDNIIYVQNPLTFSPHKIKKSKLNNHNVVWVGRIDGSKNPEDALWITKLVKQEIPDIKMVMVGGGDEQFLNYLKELSINIDIENNIEFIGFTKEIEKYLENASVFLSTTSFEGFGMTYVEALSAGLPIVTYEVPYIPMIRNSNAVISVPWKAVDVAAKAVISILKNDGERIAMGDYAKQEAIILSNYNYQTAWTKIIDSVNLPCEPRFIPTNESWQIYKEACDIAFTQLIHSYNSANFQLWECQNKQNLTKNFDYANMSKPKRWLAYLFFDHETLKSIVKYKNRNHPKRLKLYSKVWGLMRKIRMKIVPYF